MRFEERNEKLVTGVQRVSGTACDSIKHSFLSDAFFVFGEKSLITETRLHEKGMFGSVPPGKDICLSLFITNSRG